MKTYTHPTINLPAGAVVVKFYDDLIIDTETETTPNIITADGIGDVTEGFDINFTDFLIGTLDFKLHNKDNYVLSTLLVNDYMRVAVFVNNKNYFHGMVDFNTIDSDTDSDPDYNSKYSNITFNAKGIFARLRDRTIAHTKFNMTSLDPVDPSFTSHYYLRELFRSFAFMAKCAYSSASDVQFVCSRIYKYTDSGTGAEEVSLKDLIIKTEYFDTFETSGLENNYTDNAETALAMLGRLAADFFFYPQVIYDGSSFKLKIIEKDCGTIITLPPVIKRKPVTKYVLKSLYVRLFNQPATLVDTDLWTLFGKPYPEAYYGDDIVIDQLHTNIIEEDSTTTTSGDTITVTPITINVGRTDFLDDSGEAKINSGGSVFSYTGKTSTTLTGCTVPSGSIVFASGAPVRRADFTHYDTNLVLLRDDTVFGPVFPVGAVENANGSYDDTSFNKAMAFAYKSIYYDATRWMKYVVHGLVADADMDKLFVGYQFVDNGDTFLIHEVTKSLLRNQTEILALKLT